eukprot:scaffold5269_cov255-Prasinococcus_capsulatus_cf.AAC.2
MVLSTPPAPASRWLASAVRPKATPRRRPLRQTARGGEGRCCDRPLLRAPGAFVLASPSPRQAADPVRARSSCCPTTRWSGARAALTDAGRTHLRGRDLPAGSGAPRDGRTDGHR